MDQLQITFQLWSKNLRFLQTVVRSLVYVFNLISDESLEDDPTGDPGVADAILPLTNATQQENAQLRATKR